CRGCSWRQAAITAVISLSLKASGGMCSPSADQRGGVNSSRAGPSLERWFTEARFDRCRVGAQFFGADAGGKIGAVTIKAGEIVIAASADQGRNVTFVTTLICSCLLRSPIATVSAEPRLIEDVRHWRRDEFDLREDSAVFFMRTMGGNAGKFPHRKRVSK